MNTTVEEAIGYIENFIISQINRGPLLVFTVIFGALILKLLLLLISYPIAYYKSKRVGPILHDPVIPFDIQPTWEMKKDAAWNIVYSNVRLYCDPNPDKKTNSFPNLAIQKANSIMKVIMDLEIDQLDCYSIRLLKTHPIPENCRIISIKMDGFKFGKEPEEFVPVDGKIRGSYFTFQIFGDNRIQKTFYVKHGITYVAGFCIYIQNPQDWGINYDLQILLDTLNSPMYPYEGRPQPMSFTTRELTVEFCHVVDRSMLTAFTQDGVYHQEWNYDEEFLIIEKCERCTSRANRDRPPTYLSLAEQG